MEQKDKLKLADDILKYCEKYSIPNDRLLTILEDQKVVPMLRGKAMEYHVYTQLLRILPGSAWSVQKLNLNAQQGTGDEDISVTHRKTGIILKVESKSAARDSFSSGERCRVVREPHFRVKCHRSRSNVKLAKSSNDRYSVDCFDVVVSNPVNAIYRGNTIGEGLEIIDDISLKNILYQHYSVDSDAALIRACENDWRFCLPTDIGVNGFIPRTPYVRLVSDAHWKSLSDIEKTLLLIVENRRKQKGSSRRAP